MKQVVMAWRTMWEGSIVANVPTTSSQNATEDGYYYGNAMTSISLTDLGINPKKPIRISGGGNYGVSLPRTPYDYYIDGKEITNSTIVVAKNANNYGEVRCRINGNNLEITISNRASRPNLTLIPSISFTLTKIEEYY
jgi:hypothetical protein